MNTFLGKVFIGVRVIAITIISARTHRLALKRPTWTSIPLSTKSVPSGTPRLHSDNFTVSPVKL